jgi:hypothetical protein
VTARNEFQFSRIGLGGRETKKKIRVFRREHLNLPANSALTPINVVVHPASRYGPPKRAGSKMVQHQFSTFLRGLRELEGAVEGQFALNCIE